MVMLKRKRLKRPRGQALSLADLEPEDRALFEAAREAKQQWADRQDWSVAGARAENTTTTSRGVATCTYCGRMVGQDERDLSMIRWRMVLCRSCFDRQRGFARP